MIRITGKMEKGLAFNILCRNMCSRKRALEPAVRAGNERMKARERYGGGAFWENIEMPKSLSIEKNSIYGVWECEIGTWLRWRPGLSKFISHLL